MNGMIVINNNKSIDFWEPLIDKKEYRFGESHAILTNDKAPLFHSNSIGAFFPSKLQLSFQPFFKSVNYNLPTTITTYPSSDDSDNVSVLYDDPDIDDDQCLPESTIDVLHSVLDGSDDDEEDYDSDNEEGGPDEDGSISN